MGLQYKNIESLERGVTRTERDVSGGSSIHVAHHEKWYAMERVVNHYSALRHFGFTERKSGVIIENGVSLERQSV